MASSFFRTSSSAAQCGVIVHGKRITRSLNGVENPAKVSKAVGELAQGVTSGPAKLKLLVDAVFEAAGIANPYVKSEMAMPLFMSFVRSVLRRKAKKFGEDAITSVMRACLSLEEAHPGLLLDQIKPPMLQDFYDVTSVNCAPTTANNRMRAIGSIFRQAVKQGLLTSNPVHAVEMANDETVLDRQPMSEAMIAKLLTWLLIACRDADALEWHFAILFSRGAGLRLMDAVNVHPSNVTEVDGTPVISITARKTKTAIVVPVLYPPLANLLTAHRFQESFCPTLKGREDYNLSKRFNVLVKKSGIVTGTKMSGTRKLKTITFHALRHSYVTSLHDMGLPNDLAMKLTGHKSAAVHQGYNHSDVAALVSNLKRHLKP